MSRIPGYLLPGEEDVNPAGAAAPSPAGQALEALNPRVILSAVRSDCGSWGRLSVEMKRILVARDYLHNIALINSPQTIAAVRSVDYYCFIPVAYSQGFFGGAPSSAAPSNPALARFRPAGQVAAPTSTFLTPTVTGLLGLAVGAVVGYFAGKRA